MDKEIIQVVTGILKNGGAETIWIFFVLKGIQIFSDFIFYGFLLICFKMVYRLINRSIENEKNEKKK